MIKHNLLFSSQPLVINPELALKIGLNEAIVLQQLHYWVQKSKHDHDGKIWAYNTIKDWQLQFPFFSINTVRRTFENLIKEGLVVKGCFNKLKMDKTAWYTIDYMQLVLLQNDEEYSEEPHSSAFAQNEQMDSPNWANGVAQNEQMESPKMGKPIPETTQRLPKTTTTLVQKEAEKLQTDQFLQFWAAYPKKQDRAKALRTWMKIKMNADLYQTILTALETQKKGIQWQKNGGQFIPLATTWLNGQRWTDEVINYKQSDKPMTETQRRQASFEAATRGARQQDQGEFFEAQFNEVGAK